MSEGPFFHDAAHLEYSSVLLSTVKAADQAIIVDSTPPIAGKVNDGPLYKTDLVYSKDSHQVLWTIIQVYYNLLYTYARITMSMPCIQQLNPTARIKILYHL